MQLTRETCNVKRRLEQNSLASCGAEIFSRNMARPFSVVCVCLCLFLVYARPPEAKGEKKSRVYDKELSEEEHFKAEGEGLPGENEEHNIEYDHEAFLGKDKRKFDELTPEESKERLG